MGGRAGRAVSLAGALDPAVVKAYHVHGGGKVVEQIPVTIQQVGAGWLVTMQVPGFSEYDLVGNDGDNDPYANDVGGEGP